MDTLCRVCIDKATKCTPLNTKIENSSSLSFFDFLNKCTSINACERDKLPQSLCSICTHSVKTFYSFVKLTEKSDTILREALKSPIATGRYNDNREISSEEIIIRNVKIKEESEDFNKEDSFHCQTSNSTTGSSLYFLDLVKEEPRISERTSIVDFKNGEIDESDKFHSYVDHPEGSTEESDDTLLYIDSHLASIDAESSDSEEDVAISLLKTRLIKNEDETDSQSNFLSKHNTKEGNQKRDKQCNICGKKFARYQYLQHHSITHEKKEKYKCLICGKGFRHRSSRCSHMKTHISDKPYECSICGKAFRHRSNWYSHMKTHSGGKPFECETCGKKFPLKSLYDSHLRVHLNIKHTCPLCGKIYKTKKYLLSHIDAHAGKKLIKKHECEICGKKFTSKQNLNFHMDNHKGITEKCEHCDKEFTNSHALRIHLKRHSNPKTFKCKKCGKKFSSKQYLIYHMENHQGISNKCDHCDEELNSDNLSNHVNCSSAKTD